MALRMDYRTCIWKKPVYVCIYLLMLIVISITVEPKGTKKGLSRN